MSAQIPVLIKETLPSAAGFISLRQDTDWGAVSEAQAQAALSASLCGVTLYHGGESTAQNGDDQSKLIGAARVIGDGVLNLYIQDVIIAQKYRGQGYGAKLMQSVISLLQRDFPKHCTIGLMAAKGQAPFYTRFGFLSRPSPSVDAGMTAQLGTLQANQA